MSNAVHQSAASYRSSYLFTDSPLGYCVNLTKKQAEFHTSDKRLRVFAGGRGSGKSFVGALDLLLRAKPDRDYLVVGHTFGMTRDYLIPTVAELSRRIGSLNKTNRGELRLTLQNGARLWFGAGQDFDVRGFELSGAWLDEPGYFSSGDLFLRSLLPRLRQSNEVGWISATLTPHHDWHHWSYKSLIRHEDALVVRSPTSDNPYLPPHFGEMLRREIPAMAATEYDAVFAAEPPDAPGVEA